MSTSSSGKRADNRSRDLLIYIVFFIFIAAFAAWQLSILNSRPLEVKILDVYFIVSDISGFDLNTSALTFGKIMPGNTATRKVLIYNPYNFTIRIEPFASEEIAEFITMQNITVDARQNLSVPVTLLVPRNASFGERSGKVLLKIYKA